MLPALTLGSAALAAIAGVSGCSFLYDLSTTQCSTNDDCAQWPGLECRDSMCQPPVYECVTHADCLDSQEFFGSAAACIDNDCQALTTPECPLVLPVIDDGAFDTLRSAEDILFLGAFANTGGSDPYDQRARNYDLALTEFARAGVGRPTIMVVCNSFVTEQSDIDLAMNHLADTLQVPGVVAALTSDDLQHAFQTKGDAANMFFVSPLDSDSTLVRLPDRGLIWHMLPGGESLARSYAPIVERAIAYLQPTEPVRIAHLMARDQRVLAQSADMIQSAPGSNGTAGGITFNGMSVAQNSPGNYLGLNITSYYTDRDLSYGEEIQQILAFRPHIILATAADEFVLKIGPAIEDRWELAAAGQARPFYILSPYLYNTTATAEFAGLPTVRERLIGINAPASTETEAYQQYVLALQSEFPGEASLNFENYYDAAYYLMYSTIGAGQLISSGANLASGMSRLLSGLPINVGSRDLPQGVQALTTSTAGITLNGTLGPPNFDINGGRDDAGTVWCYDSAMTLQSDVLRYNAVDGTMEGTFPCFDGF